ncbi:MAG: LysR family transcriptional regulator [Nocardioides sp.]|uniref:LysR family transcriptional regulator n=1 Tax=Nocardioides sp. TaxID=35761 RepID=UPI003F0A710E
MIDLSALASLRAVAEHGSVVGAADSLGYTPSAVSQQVKRLERQTGVRLLERVGRGVLLTEQGHRLVRSGTRLLTDLESLQSSLHQESGRVQGHLRLTAFSTAVRGLVAPALSRVLREHPDLDVTLTEREPWDAVDLVAGGHADVAVVHSWGEVGLPLPAHVTEHVVATDVADVLVPEGHRLSDRSRVSGEELRGERWIATAEGSICRDWLDRLHPTRTDVAHVAAEFDSHVALVDAGLGIALVPRLGRAPLPGSVRALELVDPFPSRRIAVVHRASMAPSPAVRVLVEALSASAPA